MTYATYDEREDLRRLRVAHRRVHRITELAHEASRDRATIIARLREHGVHLSVIGAAIGVTHGAVTGILVRAGFTSGVVMGSGQTITEEVGI